MNLPRQHRLHSSQRPARFARRVLTASILAALGGATAPAWAQLPTGMEVVSGTAPATVNGAQLTVTNSNNAVLNWQSFSIGANNTVRFEQESASSKVLNRVLGNDPSSILGTLSSNGEVWLVNPHGVLFGAGSRIDVGGLVASTLGISNEDFLENRYSFGADNVAGGQVLNQGYVTTSLGGRVWMLGGSVSNEGIVETESGKIVLAAGKSIELVDSGAPNVTVRVSAPENETVNLGSLLASEGGTIDLHGAIVNQDGIVRAQSLDYDNVGGVVIKGTSGVRLGAAGETSVSTNTYNGGRILVEAAEGTATVQGAVWANNGGDIGGSVHVIGQAVDVQSTAAIEALGMSGGEVLVGGNAAGADNWLPFAGLTQVAAGAVIRANAQYTEGSGGKIVVTSAGTTQVNGELQARGGEGYSNGGLVETTGLYLEGNPRVDVSRVEGMTGTWMLNAGNITVKNDDGGTGDQTPFIRTTAIAHALGHGADVILRASSNEMLPQSGNIVLASPVENINRDGVDADGGASLTLEAQRDITVGAGAGMVADTASIAVNLTADTDADGAGGIRLLDGARFVTRDGSLRMNGGTGESGRAQFISTQGSVLDAGYGFVVLEAGSVDMAGNSSVDGGGIVMYADSVNLANTAMRTVLSEGSGRISIEGNTVALTSSQLHAADSMYIVGSNSLALNNSTLTADTEGGALDMYTSNLSSTASTLATPNGYWLMRLGLGQTAFPSAALEELGYTYVQVGASGDVWPARSGIGQHGVLMADRLDMQVRVNASREYDGTDLASFSTFTGYTPSIAGFELDPTHGNVTMETNFLDKNAGVDKPLAYSYDGYAFAVLTATDKPVFGATQSYVADITPKAISADLVAANKVYDANRTASLSGSLSGVIEGDTVSLASATGLFDSKHAGLGKTVTFASATLTGADAGNYTVTSAAATQADITQRTVGVNGLSAASKVYDGTRTAVVSGVLADALAGDVLSLDGATGLFDNKNVGSLKPVTITGVLGGADAGNYTLAGPLTVNAAITHRPLAIALTGEVRKEYDRTTTAAIAAGQFRLDGAVAGDSVAITGPAQGSFDSRNVGQAKLVTATGAFNIDGADASNYRVGNVTLSGTSNRVDTSVSGNVGVITPKTISATLVAANKVYDANRIASVSGSLSGVISGDSVSLGGVTGQFDTKHAGLGKTVTLSGASISGADAGNYTLTSAATTQADITQRAIGPNGLSAASKVYDGTRTASLSGSLADVLAGDVLSLNGAAGLFDSKDAGSLKSVTITGVLGGADAANYTLSTPMVVNAAITHRPLTIALTGEVRKEYDATALATLAADQFRLDGVLANEAVAVTGPGQGSFDSRNVGQLKQVTATGTFNINGADAFNYRVGSVNLGSTSNQVDTSASGNIGTITPKAISANVVAANKVYDANRLASLSGSLSGVLGGDSVSFSGATGQFDTKHAGIGKTVTLTGASLTGADAGNYTLTAAAPIYADITPRSIGANGLIAADKVYDGTRAAVLSGALADVLPGDVLSLDGATALFDSKQVGTAKQVAISGGTLAGADAANYILAAPFGVSAAITHRPLNIALSGDVRKEYDGTAVAGLGAGNYRLDGVLGGDSLSLSGPAQGSYDSRNVGQARQVTASGTFTIDGADAANYRVGSFQLGGTSNQFTTSASGNIGIITPKAIGATVAAASKMYDGTRLATLSGSLSGVFAGDSVSLGGLAGQFDTKAAGASQAVTITGGALEGADAGNYSLSIPLTTTGVVLHRPLDIVLTGEVRKEYDATTSAAVSASQFALNGVLANDTVTVAGPAQGSFDSANVGQQKTVTAAGDFQIAGADAGNYRVGTFNLANAANLVSTSASGNVGIITPASLVYQATPVTRSVGATGALNGTVTGWKGSDQIASATTGTLQWTSAATPTSAPGFYAVDGGGLTAANYVFAQHADNTKALQIMFDPIGSDLPQAGSDSSAQALIAAVQAVRPAMEPPGQRTASGAVTGLGIGDGAAADNVAVTTIEAKSIIAGMTADSESRVAAAAKSFSPVTVGAMSHNELSQMMDRRKDFKRKLFADAIYKLDLDPKLADVRPCVTVIEASSGACLITPAQLEEIHSAKAQGQTSVKTSRPKLASVPQIERKIAVLFGINDYADNAIPKLENAIPDVDAVGRQFADKLGYEVTIVRNPKKADIIRTLNELAARVDPSDSVVIYYAGHGYSLEKNGAGYWLAADANVNEPNSWVSNSDIAQMLTGIRSRQMSLISDSCYSGGFAREGMDAVGQDVKVEEVLAKRSVVVLSSGGDEPVADEGKGGHSIFAWHLMQVVGGIADWKPGSKIFTDVQSRVKKDFPQTPKYGSVKAAGHQPGGDFLFESRTN